MTPDAVPDPPVRPASTVIVLRPTRRSFEVLTVRRGDQAPFMSNARVFPGGTIGDADRSTIAADAIKWAGDPSELPWRAAALRELAEEAGVFLTTPPVTLEGVDAASYGGVLRLGAHFDADRLAYLSNWVTPRGPTRRYDTRFYVTAVEPGTEAAADRTEVFEAAWIEPGEALARADQGVWDVEFPTRKHLELLGRFDDCRDVLDYAATQDQVTRVEPRVVLHGDGSWRIVLQGEPGYEEGLR